MESARRSRQDGARRTWWAVAAVLVGLSLIAVAAPSYADAPSPEVAAPTPPVVVAATADQGAVRIARSGVLGFPMATSPRCVVLDSFGDVRSGGRSHEGVDMLATLGQAVYAAAGGVIVAQTVDGESDARLSGNAVKIQAPDGARSFYAHLSAFADGLTVGSSVTTGQLIGFVGDTGNPGVGNYHLHFEYHPTGDGAVDSLPLMKVPPGCQVY